MAKVRGVVARQHYGLELGRPSPPRKLAAQNTTKELTTTMDMQRTCHTQH